MADTTTNFLPSRRKVLLGGGVMLTAPFVLRGTAQSSEQVIVRTTGGRYDDVMRRQVYDPFTELTGITVIPVAATIAKMLTMARARNVELDLIDAAIGPLVTLQREGVLAPIDYGSWKWSKPDDVMVDYRQDKHVGHYVYASVLAYNTNSFPDGQHPQNWSDFWNSEKFAGPRMLADMATGHPNLEFALLADGVPMDQLYPLDIKRAFEAMSRLRPHIRKFWDTGALSSQMMLDQEVLLGSIWNGRVQPLIDQGVPLGFVWNQHMQQLQSLGVFEGAPNAKNAQMLIDFMLQPEVQARYSADLQYGPTNQKAFGILTAEQAAQLPGSPASRAVGFLPNIDWWEDNRELVNREWSNWILQ
ncbi:putative spermidine/putrescine transport system substrate-binding protein [Aminobacter niigataensis]|uniref:Spermidine/putrescine transport system substrate-binding protein n=1 Tax=Aminobacter niigataensis TaxID=83265 RepID=A0ABR6L3W8_9HYPH|nr:ABC transporter substrate-binding protein [Aminobacter niigataensis]MBB4651498.1 putative spermidine/putrescine transport system substrate-binding protein [Aminobacter niigataensis]